MLLASAALGLAQVNSMSDPAAQPQNPNSQYYSQQQATPAPVGPGTENYVEGQASRWLCGSAAHTGRVSASGAYSEVRLLSAGLADTNVNLARGSSLLEVDQIVKGTNLAVTINGATTRVDTKGLYAFDAEEQTICVLDGKLQVATSAESQALGKNDLVSLAGEHSMKRQSFDQKSVKEDPLYVWGKARSQEEAQASEGAAAMPIAMLWRAMAGTGILISVLMDFGRWLGRCIARSGLASIHLLISVFMVVDMVTAGTSGFHSAGGGFHGGGGGSHGGGGGHR